MIPAIVVVCVVGYVTIGGAVYEVAKLRRWVDSDAAPAAVLWPLVAPVWVLYGCAMAGRGMVAGIVNRATKPKLPRAEVRR